MEKSDKLIYYRRLAKSISYGKKRELKDIDFIVVHFTANANDTAKNNVDYFATLEVQVRITLSAGME